MGLSRLPTLCLCLCDVDPPISKSAGGISSALRSTAGSRPLSLNLLTTHVVATSPAQFYLFDPERHVTRRATSDARIWIIAVTPPLLSSDLAVLSVFSSLLVIFLCNFSVAYFLFLTNSVFAIPRCVFSHTVSLGAAITRTPRASRCC
jgi:hypothetical protein